MSIFLTSTRRRWREKFISVPEQGGGALIPDGPLNPGVLHTIATGSSGTSGSTGLRPRSPLETANSHCPAWGLIPQQKKASRSASTISKPTPLRLVPRQNW